MSGLRITCILLLSTFIVAVSLNAQESADDTFVTLLKVEYTGGAVAIRFETIQNEGIYYRIYRSTSPINVESDLVDARLAGEIGPDELPFTDRPESDGKYYYMVSVVKDNIEYFLFIPYQNITLTPVDFVKSVTVQKLKDTAILIPVIKKTTRPKPKAPMNREAIDQNLRTNFYRGRYSKALEDFRKIENNRGLKRRESAEIHFYSAQCLFYLGDYKGAIKLFIQGKEEGMESGMSDAWIQRCLDKMD